MYSKEILLKAFSEAKELLAHSGHKLFDPNKRYFRLGPGIVAVRPDPRNRSIMLVRIVHLKLHIAPAQEAPDGLYDRGVVEKIKEKFPRLVFMRHNQINFIRASTWEKARIIIAPTERDEFDRLTKSPQL